MADESAVLVRLRLLGAKVFSAEAKTAAGSLDSVGVAGGVAEKGLTKAKAASTTLLGPMKKLGLATGALAIGGFYEVGKQTIAFNRAMRNVNSIAQLSEGQFQSLQKSVLGLAGPTAQAPTVLAQGLYDIVSAGYSGAGALGILKSAAYAATAGLSTASVATNAIITALQSYRLPASDAAKVSDILFETVNRGVITFPELAQSIGTVLPFAATLGVNLNEVGAAVSTMTKEGLSGDEAMTRIRQTLVSLLKPGTDLKKAFVALGVSSGDDLIKKYHGLQGALEAVVGTTNGTKAAIAQLFPNVRAEGGVFALTGKNIKSANDDLAAFKDTHGATQRALSQQSKSISYQWQKLKAEASSLAITIGNKLIPVATSGLTFVNRLVTTGAVAQFAKGLTSGPGVVSPAAAQRARELGEPAPQTPLAQRAGAATIHILTSGFNGLKKVVSTVVPAVVGYVKKLVAALKPITPFLSNVLLPVLKGLAVGFGGALLLVLKLAVPLVHAAAVALGEIGKVLGPIKGPLTAVGIGMGILFAPRILSGFAAIPKLGFAFKLLGGPLRLLAGGIRPAAGLLVGLGKGFSNAALKLGRFAGTLNPGIVRSTILSVTNLVGGISSKLSGAFGKTGTLLTAAKTGALGIVKTIASTLKGPLAFTLLAAAVFALGEFLQPKLDALSRSLFKATGGVLGTGTSTSHAKGSVSLADAQAAARKIAATGVESYGDALAGILGTGAVAKGTPTANNSKDDKHRSIKAKSSHETVIHNHIHLDRDVIHRSVVRTERQLQEAT